MKEINYKEVIANLDQMINILEFDSMRSAGKAKLNAPQLHSMYTLKEIYEKKIKPTKKDK